MEVISLLLCLLGVAILPPSVGAFLLAARALSSSIASIYGLPARAHLLWLPDSPFLDGPAAAEAPDGVILLCMEEELRVVGYRPAALPAAPVSCAFCLCEIEEEQEVRELRCAHLFHRRCLDKWLRYRQRTCPLCRKFLLP